VRPTQDRVRESLFASLGGSLAGARFLDLYAGSGVVGLEALSRGADRVTWVERDRRVLAVLRRNVGELGGNVRDIVPADAMAFLRRGAGLEPFSLIFADPPYGTFTPSRDRKGRSEDMVSRFFGLIERGEWLAPGGRVIVEVDIREDLEVPPGWGLLAEKRYGRTKILITGCTGKTS
jgi:16S rRNA (guanine966-N2)-methyltransferase